MKINLQGMLGMGDNLHQRAVVRYLIKDHIVQLSTPWPQIYHDFPKFPSGNLNLIPSDIHKLRTQIKNTKNSVALYQHGKITNFDTSRRVWYTGPGVRNHGTILKAMLYGCGVPVHETDFRMPVPQHWVDQARELLKSRGWTGSPFCFYRPLVNRTEWNGCAHRNPDAGTYYTLSGFVHAHMPIISVADLVPGIEWIDQKELHDIEVKFHSGELSFELLCGVMSLAEVVLCSPGFALVMAQSIGTPVICVFGGRESSHVYESGARYTMTLGIDTIKPCQCFDHNHKCDKRIDIDKALSDTDKFLRDISI